MTDSIYQNTSVKQLRVEASSGIHKAIILFKSLVKLDLMNNDNTSLRFLESYLADKNSTLQYLSGFSNCIDRLETERFISRLHPMKRLKCLEVGANPWQDSDYDATNGGNIEEHQPCTHRYEMCRRFSCFESGWEKSL